MASLSGQITVATAGTAVGGPDQPGHMFALKAHPDNTDTVWVGNEDDGSPDVSNTTGFPINPGETLIISLANLNRIKVDVDVGNEKLCWIRLN